jgi:hypothetical protein
MIFNFFSSGTPKDLVASADTGTNLVILRFGVTGGVELGLEGSQSANEIVRERLMN